MFLTLEKYVHLADPNTKDQADLLCMVCPLVTLLEQEFNKAYTPGKNIAVDEGLVTFNGKLSLWQCMPMRPHKFGIKVWLLTDADTYYAPRFQGYLGKNCTNSDFFRWKGLVYYVVKTLGEPYLDNNQHFFFDNFFTANFLTSADLMLVVPCARTRKTSCQHQADETHCRQSKNLSKCGEINMLSLYF